MTEIESKYRKLIDDDKLVNDFNKLYNDCYELAIKIKQSHSGIFKLCNIGFSNLLSGKRLLLNVRKNESNPTILSSYVGFGNKGFGYTSSSYCNLYYNDRNLYANKDFIIKYADKFRIRVKKASECKDRFDLSIDVMSTVPELIDVIQQSDCDILIKSYSNDVHYNIIDIKSELTCVYCTLFRVTLSSSTDRRSKTIRKNDISQDVNYYHAYNTVNIMLTKHLKELTTIDNKIELFKKGKNYNELKELMDTIYLAKIL